MQLIRWPLLHNSLLLALFATSSIGAEFHVAPKRTPATPLSLAFALSASSPAKPGDTIWLHEGIYEGPFTSSLSGSTNKPIIVRQYPHERATLDCTLPHGATLTINGAWTWYWGFEVTNSSTNRSASRASGVNVFGPHTKCINLLVHDNGVGIGFWNPAIESEIYGCLIFNNGWQGNAPDRGHGHAIYAQNERGTKLIRDNILFNQFGYGLHIYTEKGSIQDFLVEGNAAFNNGILTRSSNHYANFFVGGLRPAHKIVLRENFGFHTAYQHGANVELGYRATNNTLTLESNYIAGGSLTIHGWTNASIVGNHFILLDAPISARPAAASNPFIWNHNTTNQSPAGVQVFVRRNLYEHNRANLVVFNWDLLDRVPVNLTGLVPNGHEFELRNVQDFCGASVLKEPYLTNSVQIPMTNLAVSPPVGMKAGFASPQFNVFVLTWKE